MNLTHEDIKALLPKKAIVTDELVDGINKLFNDPDMLDTYTENLLTYNNILLSGRVKPIEYANAVKFCSLKLTGLTNVDAYSKTFPDRYARLLAKGIPDKDVNSYISAYARGKVVTQILEQAYVPVWLTNASLFQKALNVQAELMVTAKSEKVRSDAANSLLNHLKQPEVAKMQLDVNIAHDNVIEDLRDSVSKLAQQQLKSINDGAFNAKQIAESSIIEAEYEDA